MIVFRAALLLSAGMLLAGCAHPGGGEVRAATTAFFAAVEANDGHKACADLAPQAAEALGTADSTCADEIVKLDLKGGSYLSAQVWGDRAEVKMSQDTVFLARFSNGWKVTGAGCEAQPQGPYDCDVEA
jgi:hypothetical protein